MRFDKLVLSGNLLERVTGFLPDDRAPGRALDTEARNARIARKNAIRAGNMDYDTFSLLPSISRARTAIRRTIAANFYAYWDSDKKVIPARFLTLTTQENIKELVVANRLWTRYVRAVEREFFETLPFGLKYLCVPEFQIRGAVHYHAVLFNFAFAPAVYDRLRDTWRSVVGGLGTANLKTIGNSGEDEGKVGSYVAKYVSKQGLDPRFFGHKRYFVSRGLRIPLVSRDSGFNSVSSLLYGLDVRTRVVDGGYVGKLELADRVITSGERDELLGSWPIDMAEKELSTARHKLRQARLL